MLRRLVGVSASRSLRGELSCKLCNNDVEDHRLGEANYVIAVDEFAEFSLPGRQALTRQELRDLCDRHKTKSAIMQALSN